MGNKNLSWSLLSLLLSACGSSGLLTTVGPDYRTAPLPTTAHWQTSQPGKNDLPIAHQGDPADLSRWWNRFHDPVLSRLLAAAEQESASVADAKARIEKARANLVGTDAALLPTIDSSIGAKRSSSSFGGAPFVWNQMPTGLQSSWEIDLFGGLARQQEAARSQLESRHAAWHDARVAVAVEVANAYLAYRYCEGQVQIVQADTESRRESARLSEIAGQAGFRAPGDVALADASAAEGNRTWLQQQAQCERSIKGLVAMTALEETDVRKLLTEAPERVAKLPIPPAFRIDALPARVLLQRPDVAVAERDVAEASAKIGVEQAKRYPKLSLSGNITPTLQNINGSAFMLAQTWAIGPTLSLPLFDAGKRAADVEAAQAQYKATESLFRSKVRTAVKEVEEALVRLNSAAERLPEARKAVSGYRTNFLAVQALYQAGLGNLIDVETARRNVLSAEMAAKDIEQEQVSAWIALYRAAGGSWESNEEPKKPDYINHQVDFTREKS
jgi:NodT family efflux transporter outer membrane factor (OMF) lipoprotein